MDRGRIRLLSIDVGIKNLAYCLFEAGPNKQVSILDWDIVSVTSADTNCKKIGTETLTECMLQALMEHFDQDFEADVVIIENQPMLKNGVMKTVAVVIFTYFNMLKLQFGRVQEVKFFSATNKLKCKKIKELVSAEAASYKDRKGTAIELARRYLVEICPDRQEWFSKLKKKDDASDCFLQGISYFERVL